MDKRLYRRVCDIYAGVTGNQPKGTEEDDILYPEQLGAFITALFNTFANGDKKYLNYFSLWNIKDFENPKMATVSVENIIKWNEELKEKK